MVDVTKIPYDLASSAIRGVYDFAIDGASDLVDDTLESAKNSLTISTQLLNNRLSSAYTEVVKIPDVIADLLFGPTSISSQARRILDPAWDAAGRVARGIWNAIDVPGIEIEEIYDSIVSGGQWLIGIILGGDEVAAVPTTEAANDIVAGVKELCKVVIQENGETKTARVICADTESVSPSSGASVPLASSSALTTAAENGSSVVVIAFIPPSTGEVASASAVASVAEGIPVVGNTPEGSSVINNAGGVEESTEEGSTGGVLQTILNFLTGTTTDSSSTSNNGQNTAATAQISGLGLLLGVVGNSSAASSTVRESPTVVPVVNTLPRPVVVALGGGSESTTVGDFVLGVIRGDSETSNITSIPSGLSVAQTLFHAAVSRALGSNGNSTSSNQGLPLGSSIPQVVVAAGLNNIADISYVPYSGNISSRISLGQADPSSSNLETGEVASNLTDGVYGLHFPTSANSDSGSEGGEQSAYETMRDLELAQSLNNPSLDGPSVVVDPSFLINQSRQVSVAV